MCKAWFGALSQLVETIYYQQNVAHARQQGPMQEAGHAQARDSEGAEEGDGEGREEA